MTDAAHIDTYRRNMVHLRRVGACEFDRARHREVERTMLLARERQRREIKRTIAPGTSRRIIETTSKVTGIALNEMLSEARTRGVTRARWVAAWIIKQRTGHSSTEIGRRLGGRDHASILHAIKQVKDDLDAGGDRFGAIVAHVERELGVG